MLPTEINYKILDLVDIESLNICTQIPSLYQSYGFKKTITYLTSAYNECRTLIQINNQILNTVCHELVYDRIKPGETEIKSNFVKLTNIYMQLFNLILHLNFALKHYSENSEQAKKLNRTKKLSRVIERVCLIKKSIGLLICEQFIDDNKKICRFSDSDKQFVLWNLAGFSQNEHELQLKILQLCPHNPEIMIALAGQSYNNDVLRQTMYDNLKGFFYTVDKIAILEALLFEDLFLKPANTCTKEFLFKEYVQDSLLFLPQTCVTFSAFVCPEMDSKYAYSYFVPGKNSFLLVENNPFLFVHKLKVSDQEFVDKIYQYALLNHPQYFESKYFVKRMFKFSTNENIKNHLSQIIEQHGWNINERYDGIGNSNNDYVDQLHGASNLLHEMRDVCELSLYSNAYIHDIFDRILSLIETIEPSKSYINQIVSSNIIRFCSSFNLIQSAIHRCKHFIRKVTIRDKPFHLTVSLFGLVGLAIEYKSEMQSESNPKLKLFARTYNLIFLFSYLASFVVRRQSKISLENRAMITLKLEVILSLSLLSHLLNQEQRFRLFKTILDNKELYSVVDIGVPISIPRLLHYLAETSLQLDSVTMQWKLLTEICSLKKYKPEERALMLNSFVSDSKLLTEPMKEVIIKAVDELPTNIHKLLLVAKLECV